MEKDLRYKILDHLKSKGKSTEEYQANKYLSTCHGDLGTIVRALLELKDEKLIFNCYDRSKSIYYQDISKIDTSNKTNGVNAKESLRFDDPENKLNCEEKIKAVRLYITLKGLDYLRDYQRFLDEDDLNTALINNTKSSKTTNWIIALGTSVIVLITLLNTCKSQKETKIQHQQEKEHCCHSYIEGNSCQFAN